MESFKVVVGPNGRVLAGARKGMATEMSPRVTAAYKWRVMLDAVTSSKNLEGSA